MKLRHKNEIHFIEPHSERKNHYIYGLRSGDKVVIIDDEVTTGSTFLNVTKYARLPANLAE